MSIKTPTGRFFKVQSSKCKVQSAKFKYCVAARHPSNGGELGMVLFVIAREHCDRGDPVNVICLRIRACIIDWIATPSAMARNDKRECVWQRGNTFLHSLTTPPLRGTPTLCVSSYLFKLRCRLFSHTRIHREGASRPWRSSHNKVAHTRGHNLLDCFAAPRMTRKGVRIITWILGTPRRWMTKV